MWSHCFLQFSSSKRSIKKTRSCGAFRFDIILSSSFLLDCGFRMATEKEAERDRKDLGKRIYIWCRNCKQHSLALHGVCCVCVFLFSNSLNGILDLVHVLIVYLECCNWPLKLKRRGGNSLHAYLEHFAESTFNISCLFANK